MTKSEKIMLVTLLFFFVMGAVVRAFRARDSKVDFKLERSGQDEKVRELLEKQRFDAMRVDLNRSSAEDFLKLSGVGPKLARAVVQYRRENGKFTAHEEVLKVKGFGPVRYNRLRNLLFIDGRPPPPLSAGADEKGRPLQSVTPDAGGFPVNINSATVEQLASLPFIGKKFANEVISYRAVHGPFKVKSDLLELKNISVTLYNKIEPHLTIE